MRGDLPQSAKRVPPKGGSRKGRPNKTSASAKAIIAEAAEKLGGVDRMVQWAQESPDNETHFWTRVFTKLVPLDVQGTIKIDLASAIETARARLNG